MSPLKHSNVKHTQNHNYCIDAAEWLKKFFFFKKKCWLAQIWKFVAQVIVGIGNGQNGKEEMKIKNLISLVSSATKQTLEIKQKNQINERNDIWLTLVSRGLMETARVRTRTSWGLRSGTSTLGWSSRTSGPPKRGNTTALQLVTKRLNPTLKW